MRFEEFEAEETVNGPVADSCNLPASKGRKYTESLPPHIFMMVDDETGQVCYATQTESGEVIRLDDYKGF